MGKKAKQEPEDSTVPTVEKHIPHTKRKREKTTLFWFELYILKGTTYKILSTWSRYTIRWLENQFHQLLNQNPPDLKIPELIREETYLLVDGQWFVKRNCLMLYRHHKRKYLFHASFYQKSVDR